LGSSSAVVPVVDGDVYKYSSNSVYVIYSNYNKKFGQILDTMSDEENRIDQMVDFEQ
jgi:hypothetical protein